MNGLHVTQEDFEAVERGELTVEEVNRRYRRHARELCPVCRREHEELLRRRRLYGRAQWLSLLLLLLREVVARWEREKAIGDQELAELMALPPSERRRRVSRARKRFRSPHLAEALLGQSRARTFEDPPEARSLARLSFHVALRFDERHQDEAPAFRNRALAAEANALRCLGRLREASRTMDFVLESTDEIPEDEERADLRPLPGLAPSSMKFDKRFPPGWNEQRVREVIELLDNQSDEEAAADLEKALAELDATRQKESGEHREVPPAIQVAPRK